MYFSVLIPVYGVDKYLRTCVDSVLNQEEQDFEIILVDDGSADGCAAICDEYAARFPGAVRVLHQKNQGLMLARRAAMRAARGEWLVHLDSDDFMLPGALAAVRRTAESSGADLVLCKVAYGEEDGVRIREESRLPFADGEVFTEKHPLWMQFLYGGRLTAIYQKIARREIADIDADYRKWRDVGIMEDHLQSLPLLDRSKKPVFLDRSLVYYRIHGGGMTRQKRFDAQLAIFRSMRCVYMEEEAYRAKWGLSERENAMICARHMRQYCRVIREMHGTADRKRLRAFLLGVRDDTLIRKEFEMADRKTMGGEAWLCFRLIGWRAFFLLRLLFAARK